MDTLELSFLAKGAEELDSAEVVVNPLLEAPLVEKLPRNALRPADQVAHLALALAAEELLSLGPGHLAQPFALSTLSRLFGPRRFVRRSAGRQDDQEQTEQQQRPTGLEVVWRGM